eukprot:TRINITY_DN809_c1_g1_i3.p1 TRINITY_DN809_c1_g1~~TRINITY_DN809_c1_g1_i3.p1  ORF type:complete len:259 (+),score=26.62 TRINITY_DN809_c1_g1_i3:53-829(+)
MSYKLSTILLVVSVVCVGTGRCEDEDVGDEIVFMDRDAQIANIELELAEAKRHASPFKARYENVLMEQRRVDNGWFGMGAEAKRMQPIVDEAHAEFQNAQREVDILRAQIKPLYGVVSVQHLTEHREAIHQSFQNSVKMAQNHMWWDFILGNSRSDSVEGALMNLLMSFMAGLSIGYVIGFIQFIITAPFTIFQYCSSITDLPAAIFMWIVGMVLFLLPILGVYFTCVAVNANRRRGAGANMAMPEMRRRIRVGGGGY